MSEHPQSGEHAGPSGRPQDDEPRVEAYAMPAIEPSKLVEAVFDQAISPIAVLDRDYNFLRVNVAYARACRRGVDEFAGRNHFELYPSDAKPIFDEVVRSRRPFTASARPFVFPDQPERGVTYWDWTLVPVPNAHGEVEWLVLSLVDVTERKRAEASLATYARGQDFLVGTALRLLQPFQGNELFDFVAEQVYQLAGGGLVQFSEFDPLHRQTILRALACTEPERAEACRLFGRDPVGITLDFPEPVRNRMLPGELEQLHGGVCELAFYQLPSALCQALEQGLAIRHVYAMAFSVEQDLLGTIAVLTHGDDLPNKRLIESIVTQAALALKRNRIEEQLRSERNFFDAVFDTQGAIVAVLDRDFHLVRLNRAYYDITGYRYGSMVGQHIRELIGARDAELVESQLGGIARHRTIGEFESRLRVQGGSMRDISWRTTVRQNAAGDVEYLIATGIDVTARRRTEDALRRANAELQQFAYVASHDLRAPLRAVSNLSSWLEDDLAPQLSGESRHHLQLLRERVRLMDDLINGLLTYSRAGGQTRVTETVDSAQLVSEVIGALDVRPGLQLVIEDGMPTLVTDPTKLQQVFSNLLGNAVKYHDRPDGHVWVSARDLGEQYEFSVADDGPGIPPEFQEKVFQMLQRGPAAKEHEGTGMGLAVVKKLVESSGGRIHLESSPGHGAAFRFTWPKVMLVSPAADL